MLKIDQNSFRFGIIAETRTQSFKLILTYMNLCKKNYFPFLNLKSRNVVNIYCFPIKSHIIHP